MKVFTFLATFLFSALSLASTVKCRVDDLSGKKKDVPVVTVSGSQIANDVSVEFNKNLVSARFKQGDTYSPTDILTMKVNGTNWVVSGLNENSVQKIENRSFRFQCWFE